MKEREGKVKNERNGTGSREGVSPGAGDDGTGETEPARVRGADEKFPGHRPIPVHPLQRLAAFCRRHGGRACHQTAVRQAAPAGKETMVSDPVSGLVRLKNGF